MAGLPQFYMGSPMILEATLRRNDQRARDLGGLAQFAGWVLRRAAERRQRLSALDAELEKYRAMMGEEEAQAEADRGSERPATAPSVAPEPEYDVDGGGPSRNERGTLSELGQRLWRGFQRGVQEAGSIVGVTAAPGEEEKLRELSRLMGRAEEREARRKGGMVGFQVAHQYANPAAVVRAAQTGEIPSEGLEVSPMAHAPTNEWSATVYASQFPPGDPRRVGIDALLRQQYELDRARIAAAASRQGSDLDWLTKQMLLAKLAGELGGSGDDRSRNAMIGRHVAAGLGIDPNSLSQDDLMRLATSLPLNVYVDLSRRLEKKDQPLFDPEALVTPGSPLIGGKKELPVTIRNGRWIDKRSGQDLGPAPSWLGSLVGQGGAPGGTPGEVEKPPLPPGGLGPSKAPAPEPSAKSWLPQGLSVDEDGNIVDQHGIRYGKVGGRQGPPSTAGPRPGPPIKLPNGLTIDKDGRIVNEQGIVFGHVLF